MNRIFFQGTYITNMPAKKSGTSKKRAPTAFNKRVKRYMKKHHVPLPEASKAVSQARK